MLLSSPKDDLFQRGLQTAVHDATGQRKVQYCPVIEGVGIVSSDVDQYVEGEHQRQQVDGIDHVSVRTGGR